MLVRVYFLADGSVAIRHYNPRRRRPEESESECLERLHLKHVVADGLKGLKYEDMDISLLPVEDEETRDKWQGKKGKGVKIDPSVVTPAEKRQAIVDELDAELAKASPDFIQLIILQRKLDKRDY